MSKRFLHLGFTWKDSAPKLAELEAVLNGFADDWLRYSPECWIAWTDRPASDFLYAVKPLMGANDLVLIVGLDMSDRNGWEPQWIWEWIDKKREVGPPPPPAPPPADWTTTNALSGGVLGFGGLGTRPGVFGVPGLLSQLPPNPISGLFTGPPDNKKQK